MHPIIVVNEAPLSNILNNPSATGCVSLWGIELSPMDITYEKKEGNQVAKFARFYSRMVETAKHGTTRSVECLVIRLQRIYNF
jgi:hypothetical protein